MNLAPYSAYMPLHFTAPFAFVSLFATPISTVNAVPLAQHYSLVNTFTRRGTSPFSHLSHPTKGRVRVRVRVRFRVRVRLG